MTNARRRKPTQSALLKRAVAILKKHPDLSKDEFAFLLALTREGFYPELAAAEIVRQRSIEDTIRKEYRSLIQKELVKPKPRAKSRPRK